MSFTRIAEQLRPQVPLGVIVNLFEGGAVEMEMREGKWRGRGQRQGIDRHPRRPAGTGDEAGFDQIAGEPGPPDRRSRPPVFAPVDVPAVDRDPVGVVGAGDERRVGLPPSRLARPIVLVPALVQ